MGKFKQVEKAMSVSTPLGTDVLLLERFRGVEALSSLFRFELDLLAEADATISFDKVLGKAFTVTFPLEDGTKRYVNGIVQEFAQGEMVPDARGGNLIRYHAVLVPKLWRLSRTVRSRIFQQQTVPQILQTVLAGLDADTSAIQGTFQPRDYCAQYRESDFAFASRLMEDEGIWYCFEHSSSGHRLILGNSPQGHHGVPGPTRLTYQPITGGVLPDNRILTWEKRQAVHAHKVTLHDYCFEMADQPLQSSQSIQASVQAGTVTHPLAADGSEQMEITDFPGTYAGRFDGVGPNGEDQSSQLQHISPDGDRTAGIRMQQEATPALRVRGDSSCRQLQAGSKFTLQKHFNGDGPYVLTRVEHEASVAGAFTDASQRDTPLQYHNRFEALPQALPFRPVRETPRPRVAGVQTAVVVGHSGEQVNCDKYGRVKVQFRWDPRQGSAATGSCWIRVGQVWAGKGWGAFFWPRAGHEVVVAFEEGDIDQPLIVGNVYNSAYMPPFELPDNALLAGIKSCSQSKESGAYFNGFVLDDNAGKENLTLHGQRRILFNAEQDKVFCVDGNHNVGVGGHFFHRVGGAASVGGGSGGAGVEESGSGGAGLEGSGSGGADLGGANWPPSSWTVDGMPGVPTFGFANTNTFGVSANLVAGIAASQYLGAYMCLTISPSIFFSDTAPAAGQVASKFGQAMRGAFGGYANVVLGANTNFVVGPAYNVHYGTSVTIDEAQTSLAGAKVLLAAKVTAGLAVLQAAGIAFTTPGVVSSSLIAAASIAELIAIGVMAYNAAQSNEAPTVLQQIDMAASNANANWAGLTAALTALNTSTTTATQDITNLQGGVNQLNGQMATANQNITNLQQAPGGVPQMQNTLNDLANRVTFTNGNFAQYAQNIFLVSNAAPAAAAGVAGPPDSSILVAALGNGNNGNLVMLGTNLVTVSAGSAALLLQNTAQDNGTVTVSCGPQGSIALQRGPANAATQTITIADDGSITISSTAATNITLQTQGGAINVQSNGGNITLAAEAGNINLTGQAINLTGTESVTLMGPAGNSVTVDNQGNVNLQGLNAHIQMEVQAQIQAAQLAAQLNAQAQFTAPTNQIL